MADNTLQKSEAAPNIQPSVMQQPQVASTQPGSPEESSKQGYDQQKTYIADDFVLREELKNWWSDVQQQLSSFLNNLQHTHPITVGATETNKNKPISIKLKALLDAGIVQDFKEEASSAADKVNAPLQGEASQFINKKGN